MIRFLSVGIAFLGVTVGIGCGSSEQKFEVVAAKMNLRAIGTAYVRATETLNRGPANVKELTPYLKEQGDPDELLRSSGEEFVILWGVDYRAFAASKKPPPVIAYEKSEHDGKRYVLLVRAVIHMTDEDFRKAPFPPGQKPPP